MDRYQDFINWLFELPEDNEVNENYENWLDDQYEIARGLI